MTYPDAVGLLAGDPHALPAWLPQFRKWATQLNGASIADEVAQDVAIACLKLMRSTGFPCDSELKLQCYIKQMVRNKVLTEMRRRKRCVPVEETAIDEDTAPTPLSSDAWMQFNQTRERALACIRTTTDQRRALERRIESALGADLVSLLQRDGRLAKDATPEERQRVVENEGRLQRSSLSILERALDLAEAQGMIDPDDARFGRRVAAGLRERASKPRDTPRSSTEPTKDGQS